MIVDRKTFAKCGLSSLLGDYYGDNAKRAVKDAFKYEDHKDINYMKEKHYKIV
jgi:hypothetical protein